MEAVTEEQEPEADVDDGREGEDERPPLEDEETASFDLEEIDVDEVEAEAGASSDDVDDQEDDAGEQASGESAAAGSSPSASGTWGDMYVESVTTLTNAVIEHHADNPATVDANRARELHLDEYFNDWMAQHGKREDMPPEQALLVGTLLFAAGAMAQNSEIITAALND